MKYILAILLVIFTVTPLYADITYSKISDTIMAITDTKEVVTTDNVTLALLKTQKASLEAQKVSSNNSIDAQIVVIDAKIAEAVNLGIKEIDDKGDILNP